ncbi:hypothetical protein ACFL3M_03325 [Patescibacteria group bacterium]
MSALFSIIYMLMTILFVVVSLFIIYHIIKYSLNKTSSFIMFIVFTSGMTILLLLNFYLYTSVNIEDIFYF